MFETNKFLGLAYYGVWKVEVRVILIMVVRTSDQFIGDFLSLFRYSVKNLIFALEHVKMDLEGG